MTDRIAATVLIAVSAAFVAMALRIEPSFFSDPLGPKFVPIAIGLFLAGASIALLIKPRSVTHWPDASTWTRLALCLATFVAYALLLVPVGFIASTALAYAVFAMLFRGRPLPSLLAGAVFAVACYLLFSVGLDLFLPTGRIFEGWF